jgi:phosphohistidine swiveling domain-containing protein
MPPLIIKIEESRSLKTTGGKALGLARLISAGFPVPRGYVITAQAFDSRPPYVSEALKAEIIRIFHRLQNPGQVPVAVRSSAAGEDQPGFSFAGQYLTVLNVKSETEFLSAVQCCRASLESPGAAGYHRRHKLTIASGSMAVIVQQMVSAQTAGAIFTSNPVNGQAGQMLINAARGLGENLVSGLITPDEYTVNKTDGRINQGLTGKTPVLPNGQIKELTVQAQKIEDLFGAPQDIEWAHDGKQFWFLQSRPITAMSPPAVLPDVQWGNPVNQKLSLNQVVFWSNWNTRENMAYPLKPMAWSFFNDLLVPVIGDVLYGAKPGSAISQYSQFIDLVNGQAYWNMSMLAGHPLAGRMIMPHLDKLDREAAADFSELQKRGEFVPAVFPIPRHQLAAAIIKGTITFITFPWLASPCWIEKRCQRFLVQAREYVELPLEQMSIEQMLAEARRYGEIISRFTFPLLVVASKSILGLAVIDRLIKKYPDLKSEGLLAGIPGNKTTETALDLYKLSLAPDKIKNKFYWAEFRSILDVEKFRLELWQSNEGREFLSRVDAFLEEYGHRGTKDLDVGHPSWKEDPTYIFAMLKSYMTLGPKDQNPLEQFQRAVAGRLALESEIRARLSSAPADRLFPFRRWVFDWALKMVHEFLPWRENEKFYGVKVFPGSRRIIAEIGRRYAQSKLIGEPEDIYFLTIPEIERQERGSGLGSVQMKILIAGRQSRWQKQLNRPGEFIIRSDGKKVIGLTTSGKEGKILRGVAASGGRVTGKARIIRDPSQAHKFKKGEILVAPYTEPGWAPLFLLSKALVMEVGGSICHGAIVAREYGIPAVVGAKGAMERIKDGDMITVDGDSGEVIISENLKN